MPDVLNVVVVLQEINELGHIFDVVLASELNVILRYHLNGGLGKGIALTLQSSSDRIEVIRVAGDLKDAAIGLEVRRAAVQRVHHHRLFIQISILVVDDDDALAVKAPGHAAAGAHVSAVLVEEVADLRCGAVAVVGEGLHDNSHAAGTVAFVDHLLKVVTGTGNQSLVDGIVVSDNYKAGAQCAKDLMKRKKKGKILFLVQSENKSAIDRIKGFKETLEKAGWNYENIGDIECKGQLEVSQPLVENVLTKTKDIDVVVALNDPSAMGAMAALDAEHMLSDVLVYGADGSPEAKTMIYKNRMTATAAQSPRITGKKTVEMLYKILAGKPVESQYIVPVRLITRDNVEDYSLSGWQ